LAGYVPFHGDFPETEDAGNPVASEERWAVAEQRQGEGNRHGDVTKIAVRSSRFAANRFPFKKPAALTGPMLDNGAAGTQESSILLLLVTVSQPGMQPVP